MTDEGKPSPSDAELIERCLRKDNAAWEIVVGRYSLSFLIIGGAGRADAGEREDPGLA